MILSIQSDDIPQPFLFSKEPIMANANCGCNGNQNGNNRTFRGVVPFELGVSNQRHVNGENCEQGVAMTPTLTFLPHEMCDPCPQGAPMPKWVPWLIGGIVGLLLFTLLLWALIGGQRASVVSATMAPQQFAQAGQPVSATANPVNYTEINLNGAQLASTGVKPSVKPTKPAVPAKSSKAVVFDPNGTMRAYGVELAVDGANYAIYQTSGELASPNDIAAAQAARPNGWVTVVLDPSGPYAVNHKGNVIPVTMDNMGRILVPVSQVHI